MIRSTSWRSTISAKLAHQRAAVLDRVHVDDEAFEIIVIVIGLGVVMRGPDGEIVFGRRMEPEQDRGVDSPLSGCYDLYGAGDLRGYVGERPAPDPPR